jgi:uncharacterized protein
MKKAWSYQIRPEKWGAVQRRDRVALCLCVGAALFTLAGDAQARTSGEDAAAREPFSTDLKAAGPKGPLAGTFLNAGAKAPLIIILPGSGPTDRDGNNPLGVTASSYRLLAEALGRQGISSLRADKRGMFGSKAAIPDANAVTIADYVVDVNSWTAALQSLSPRRCIWLAGHSEGGLVALVAAQNNDRICGVILIAAPGRKLNDVMREQLQANPANAPILPDALRALDALAAGQRVDVSKMHPVLQSLFNPAIQPFLGNLFSYDPAKLAAAIRKPLLIIQGGRDMQVSVADADRLALAQPKATKIIIADMTHVLKAAASDDPAANMRTYTEGALPISPTLVGAIAKFVKAAR